MHSSTMDGMELQVDHFVDDLYDDFELEFQRDLWDDTIETDNMRVDSDYSINSDYEEKSDGSRSDSDSTEDPTPPVIDHIEDIVLSFLTQLAYPGKGKGKQEHGDMSSGSGSPSKRPSKADYNVELHLVDRKKSEIDGMPATKRLRYPKKNKHGSSQPFAQLFRVLDIAHEATLNDIPVTKRDIYYQDVPLFKKQIVVDGIVDDLAATFQLERSDLNIRSASKGIVCSSGLTITLISGEIIECNDTEGTLIPAGEDIETFSVDEDIAWVLVVEKEAVFQTMCRLHIPRHDSMPGPGILITGKGYPDVATRHLVKSLADALPRSVPILGMVDGDPFGLDILSVYKYGSTSMQHENGKLATKRIKWLGIWASELDRVGVRKDHLLPITRHDEKKALAMLKRTNKPLPRSWKKELQQMLHSRRKAEIEVLSSPRSEENSTGFDTGNERVPHKSLLDYLTSKLSVLVSSTSQ